MPHAERFEPFFDLPFRDTVFTKSSINFSCRRLNAKTLPEVEKRYGSKVDCSEMNNYFHIEMDEPYIIFYLNVPKYFSTGVNRRLVRKLKF